MVVADLAFWLLDWKSGCLVGILRVFVVRFVRSEQRLAFAGSDLVVHVCDVGGGVRVRQGGIGGAASTEVWNGLGLRLCFDLGHFLQFGLDLDPVFGLSSWVSLLRFCFVVFCCLFVVVFMGLTSCPAVLQWYFCAFHLKHQR